MGSRGSSCTPRDPWVQGVQGGYKGLRSWTPMFTMSAGETYQLQSYGPLSQILPPPCESESPPVLGTH